MDIKYTKYIKKKTNLSKWPPHRVPEKLEYSYIISIPCYDEYDYIFRTLESINKQSTSLLKDLLVSIVVNNSDAEDQSTVQSNHKTFRKLIDCKFNYDLMVIDAYSDEKALPEREAGVGMARKISVDACLEYSRGNSVVCFIDADSLLDSEYLSRVHSSYTESGWDCATVSFTHQKDDPQTIQYIEDYESLLKYNALKINESGSPYSYVPLGSTMICTTSAYIAVGGMNKKKAAEDFYFLQDLQKYRNIFNIKDILVYPSSRSNDRCYLGTSMRMKKCINGELSIDELRYSERSYTILKRWIDLALDSQMKSSQSILERSLSIDSKLPSFLEKYNFSGSWEGIKDSPSERHFTSQFHRWFDAFKTFKLLKEFS